MNLIFLGAPGAGKGTQAEVVSEALNIPQISTGNILREAAKNGTEYGLKAKAAMRNSSCFNRKRRKTIERLQHCQ